ncbi:MAG: hypothetical protein WCG47_24195 [Dermatophilaceae bacterium]
MTVTTGLWTRGMLARWTGGLYLGYILASVLATRLGHIGLSDAPTLGCTPSTCHRPGRPCCGCTALS